MKKEKSICKYEGKRVLLVEGKDDCHVIMALCEYYRIPEVFGIYECNDKGKVLQRLNALINQPDDTPEVIGVILDADNIDIIDKWQQIGQKIKEHQYDFPEKPDTEGTILSENKRKPKIGIWIMPDNRKSGMLEDFLIKMAKPEAVLSAQECVNTAREKGVTAFKNVHYSKAILHTYLAWQDEPGKPMGQSVSTHALQPHTEIARIFVNWLKRLFVF